MNKEMSLQGRRNYCIAWEKSGKSRLAFCKANGISPSTFQGITSELKQNPKEGVYLFYNRHRDKIKGLSWHKNGFVLFYKRMESGRFSMNFNKASGAIDAYSNEREQRFH